MSSKRSTRISRIKFSQSNQSISMIDDENSQSEVTILKRNSNYRFSQSFIGNFENSAGESTISKKIENIQKLTANSPLNNPIKHNLTSSFNSTKTNKNLQIYNFNNDFSLDDSQYNLNLPKSVDDNVDNFNDLNDVNNVKNDNDNNNKINNDNNINDNNDEICSLPVSSNDNKTKIYDYSDCSNFSQKNLSFFSSNNFVNQLSIKKNVSNHKKTNSLTFNNGKINYQCYNIPNTECTCKNIIFEINQNLNLVNKKIINEYITLKNNVQNTLDEIKIEDSSLLKSNIIFNDKFDWINFSNLQNKKSFLFVKYVHELELAKLSENYMNLIKNIKIQKIKT